MELPKTYSFWHKVKVVVAFAFAVTLVVSMFGHLIMGIQALTGPKPSSISWHLKWPHMTINHAATPGSAMTSGSVTPGVSPGVRPGPEGGDGDKPVDDCYCPRPAGGHEEGVAIDLKFCVKDGSQVCILCPFETPVPGWVCTAAAVIVLCILLAILLGVILEWICQSEWVKEEVSFKVCGRRKCKWYDLVCHVKKLICYTCTFFRWLLQQICGWINVLVWAMAIACIVGGILVVVAFA